MIIGGLFAAVFVGGLVGMVLWIMQKTVKPVDIAAMMEEEKRKQEARELAAKK